MNVQPIVKAMQAGALLSTGVVYGTDAFFSIVGAKALAQTSAAGLSEVMGRLHEVADRRMPVVGAAGLVLSLSCALGSGTTRGRVFGAAAAAMTVAYIVLYTRYSKPINDQLTAAAQSGTVVGDAHALQGRWDGIVYVRYALMSVAMLCLVLVTE